MKVLIAASAFILWCECIAAVQALVSLDRLPASDIIAADPELGTLAHRIEDLRMRRSGAEWELVWALENAAEKLNGDYIVGTQLHPAEARRLLVEAMGMVPNARKPENIIGPPVPYLRQQAHYGLGKAALDLYDQRAEEYASKHPIISLDSMSPSWDTTTEAHLLLTDAAMSFRAAIDDEIATKGVWQPEADQMMQARLGLLQAVWARDMWPETFAAARAIYDFLYTLSPRQGDLSYFVQQRAISQLRRLVGGYLGYLTSKKPGTRSDEYLFQALQMAEASYELHAVDLASSRMRPGVSGAAGLLQDYQLALEVARSARRELFNATDAALGAFLNGRTTTWLSSSQDDPTYIRLLAALKKAEQARTELATLHPLETSTLTPSIVSIEDIQAALRPHEGLLFIYIGELDSVSWVITPVLSEFRVAAFRGQKQILPDVAIIRRSMRLNHVTQHPPEFAAGAAYRLYSSLLESLRPLLKNTQTILLVESWQLRSIPLAILLEQKPKSETFDTKAARKAPWLVRDFAFTVLPTVSSLRALRTSQMQRPQPPETLLAMGDPDLDEGCYSLTALMPHSGDSSEEMEVSGLCNLPGAGSELDQVAGAIAPSSASRVILKKASATVSKLLATKPERFEVIYFATHALLPALNPQTPNGVHQAALVMTPEGNQGGRALLKTSDIMPMHLSADLVVLSGCDTAGRGEDSPEALTGLARAFFFAGARELLATNWRVDSDATVALMTVVFNEFRTVPDESVPQVLRAAQLKILSEPSATDYAHPVFWGSFVVVGEGGRPGIAR